MSHINYDLRHMQMGDIFMFAAGPSPVRVSEEITGDIAPWGDTNMFPREVYTQARKNTLICSTLEMKALALYGSGIKPMRVIGVDQDNNEVLAPVSRKEAPNVYEFLRTSGIHQYLRAAAMDFYWFYNVFPEIILSTDRKQVAKIHCHKAMNCRLGKHNAQGVSDKLYISANWESDAVPEDAKTLKILDSFWEPERALREGTEKSVAYPLSFATPGENHYALAPWNSVRESGWLAFANAIPEFKMSLMNHELAIKYHIEVADWWWDWKFKGFKDMTPEEREACEMEVRRDMEKVLTGAKNAGKSIFSVFKVNPHSGKEEVALRITAIANNSKNDGVFREDGLTANEHLLFALGVPASLRGNTPGKGGMGAGSGSDVREHWNSYLSLCMAHEHLLLEPLLFAHRYNGFPDDITYKIDRPVLRTQNQLSPSQRTVTP